MNDDSAGQSATSQPLRPYETPQVICLGDLRDITLGASPGNGDSGGATTFKCPGCP